MAAIGEYEMAIDMAERLEKLEQRGFFAESALADFRRTDGVTDSLRIFEQANRDGISCYTKGDLDGATKAFRLALTAAPTNTGVALNLIQSLLESSRAKRKPDANELTECRETFKLLDGVPLPEKQKQRQRELKQGFDALMAGRR